MTKLNGSTKSAKPRPLFPNSFPWHGSTSTKNMITKLQGQWSLVFLSTQMGADVICFWMSLIIGREPTLDQKFTSLIATWNRRYRHCQQFLAIQFRSTCIFSTYLFIFQRKEKTVFIMRVWLFVLSCSMLHHSTFHVKLSLYMLFQADIHKRCNIYVFLKNYGFIIDWRSWSLPDLRQYVDSCWVSLIYQIA
jgi:hypothetical protein